MKQICSKIDPLWLLAMVSRVSKAAFSHHVEQIGWLIGRYQMCVPLRFLDVLALEIFLLNVLTKCAYQMCLPKDFLCYQMITERHLVTA